MKRRTKVFEEEFKVTEAQHECICQYCCSIVVCVQPISYITSFTQMQKVADDPNGVHNVATANRSKNRYHNIHTCKFRCAHFRLF